jgi:predicted DNA-binding protein (MmcQ/YjbR family)
VGLLYAGQPSWDLLPMIIPVQIRSAGNLKCAPDLAIELRASSSAVSPDYPREQAPWNTVELDGSIENDELGERIGHSNGLVVSKLPRAERNQLSSDSSPTAAGPLRDHRLPGQ